MSEGISRRDMLRVGAMGVAGGVAAWSAPAIMRATPAGAVLAYYLQYDPSTCAWETTTDPQTDMGGTDTEWASCVPQTPWSTGEDPGDVPTLPAVTYGGSGCDCGTVTFTAPTGSRITAGTATVYVTDYSGAAAYDCEIAGVSAGTENTATFDQTSCTPSLGEFRLKYRLYMESAS